MNSLNYFNPNPPTYCSKGSYLSKTFAGLLFQVQQSPNKLANMYAFVFRYNRKFGPKVCGSWYENRARTFLKAGMSEEALTRVTEEIRRHYQAGVLQWHLEHERPNAAEVERLRASIEILEAKYRKSLGF